VHNLSLATESQKNNFNPGTSPELKNVKLYQFAGEQLNAATLFRRHIASHRVVSTASSAHQSRTEHLSTINLYPLQANRPTSEKAESNENLFCKNRKQKTLKMFPKTENKKVTRSEIKTY
jgi:hypothetical protein